MNTALQIRLLPTHTQSVPAKIDVRSITELLQCPQNPVTTRNSAPQVLNHPPIILIRIGGGEELLNRDCVKLQFFESPQTLLPENILAYAIEESQLEISVRVIRFLYGQLQILNYRKTDGKNTDLRKTAINEIVNNSELQLSIARDIFNTSKLEMKHYKKIFASAKIEERQLRNLINSAKNVKNKSKTNPEKPINKTATVKDKNSTGEIVERTQETVKTNNTSIEKRNTNEQQISMFN